MTPSKTEARGRFDPCDCCRSTTATHDTACHHYGELRTPLPPLDQAGDALKAFDSWWQKRQKRVGNPRSYPDPVEREAFEAGFEAALSLSQDRLEGVGELRAALDRAFEPLVPRDDWRRKAIDGAILAALGSQHRPPPDFMVLEELRPVETAPKDGSYFLFVGSNFDGGMAVVQWDAGLEWWTLDDGKNPEIALRHESGLIGWLPLPKFRSHLSASPSAPSEGRGE